MQSIAKKAAAAATATRYRQRERLQPEAVFELQIVLAGESSQVALFSSRWQPLHRLQASYRKDDSVSTTPRPIEMTMSVQCPMGHIQWQHPLQGPAPPPLPQSLSTQARGSPVARSRIGNMQNGPAYPRQDNKRKRGEEEEDVRDRPVPFSTRACSTGGSTISRPAAQGFRTPLQVPQATKCPVDTTIAIASAD